MPRCSKLNLKELKIWNLRRSKSTFSVLFSLIALCCIFLLFFICGCQQSHETTLKVAATSVPHADLLEVIKPDLEANGVCLKIIEVDDYNLPNRLLFEKQVDANFFQHTPFLEEQNQRFGYSLVPLVAVHIEPLGIFSRKIESLNSVKDGAVVAIPSDPTNEARALLLLNELQLITLKKDYKSYCVTVYDIADNPKHLKLEEVDAAFLPRVLTDVDLAIIPANFALQAKLDPTKDALALESMHSPYANVVVIRDGDETESALQKLKAAMTSEKMRQYIKEKYKGSIVPVF